MFKSGRFPHALLIEGNAKSGKKSLAILASSYLLCRRAPDVAPCGNCSGCNKLKSQNNPDLLVIDAENSKSLGVKQIRELRLQAQIKPHESERRVILIPNAQKLTAASQNVLLKLLEEPPRGLYVILTADSKHSLLPTVRSRLGIISIPSFTLSQRIDALHTLRGDVTQDEIERVCAMTFSIGQALHVLDDKEARKRSEDAFFILRHCLSVSVYELVVLLASYERDRETYMNVLSDAKTICAAMLHQPDYSHERLKLVYIAAIIERAIQAAGQNLNLRLVSSVLAESLTNNQL